MLPALRWIILILATGPIVYGLMSLYAVVSYFRGLRKMVPRRDVFSPPVSILKPVRGADNGAYENFASYCQLDYPEYEILFCARYETDLGLAIALLSAAALRRDFAEPAEAVARHL